MKTTIDARGLACPQPVILVKNNMKDFSEIEVLVDNEAALENIKRLAAGSGYSFSHEATGNAYRINLALNDNQSCTAGESISPSISGGKSVIVISSDMMGNGDEELGRLLMKAFIHTATTLENFPEKIIFYNSGVMLTAEGSGVNDDLDLLEKKGCKILICGTCVNYFNIKDKIKTGTISNMYEIAESLNSAPRIIRP